MKVSGIWGRGGAQEPGVVFASCATLNSSPEAVKPTASVSSEDVCEVGGSDQALFQTGELSTVPKHPTCACSGFWVVGVCLDWLAAGSSCQGIVSVFAIGACAIACDDLCLRVGKVG